MHHFKKLEVWKKSRILVKEIFIVANKFPKEEVYGLISQVKRCSISIPSNIAEGCGRGTDKQLRYHLNVALGSAYELETQIILAGDLNYIIEKKVIQLIEDINEISRMIVGLNRSLKIIN